MKQSYERYLALARAEGQYARNGARQTQRTRLGASGALASAIVIRSAALSTAAGISPADAALSYRARLGARRGAGLWVGGSFLGTAASTAAGVIGGGLLLNSIRSMFGDHAGLGGHERSALGNSTDSSADSYLAQQDRDQDQDQDQDDDDQAQEDQDQDQDQDQDDDAGDFSGDDTDYA
jgi:hypothetical protein